MNFSFAAHTEIPLPTWEMGFLDTDVTTQLSKCMKGWNLVFGAWYLVFGASTLVYPERSRRSQHDDFGIWNLEFGIWYLVFGTWYLVFDTRNFSHLNFTKY